MDLLHSYRKHDKESTEIVSSRIRNKQHCILFTASNLFRCVLGLCLMTVGAVDFLYKDNEHATFVIDYVAPEDDSGSKSSNDKELPFFLKSPDNGNRVVEFYSPWCGHCQHFAPKYMELAKKTSREDPSIKFYAVSCVAYRPICKAVRANAYPTIFIIYANSIKRVEVSQKELLEASIPDLFKVPDSVREDNMFSKEILASFVYNLRNDLFRSTSKPLDTYKKQVLSDWLSLLSYTLPETWTPLTSVTHDLIENFDTISNNKWELKKLIADVDVHKPACYYCGLWQLFHVISVGLVEHNSMISDKDTRVSTMQAANVIRNFIEEFFGCEECAARFTSWYDSCWNDWCKLLTDDASTSSDQEFKELAIWLWDVHNYMNVKLLEKEGTDVSESDEIKAQWPSRSDCNGCWNTDKSYNADAVYAHLKDFYWPEEAKAFTSSAVSFKRLGQPVEGDKDAKPVTSSTTTLLKAKRAVEENDNITVLTVTSNFLMPLTFLCLMILIYYFFGRRCLRRADKGKNEN